MLCLCMCGHCVSEGETVGDDDDMQVDNGTTFYLHYNHVLVQIRYVANCFVQIRYGAEFLC
jgi:hypothetical protein